VNAGNVVIVEDEFLVAFQLEDILTDGGYHVVATVPDMAAADAVCEQTDLALVDVNLRDGPTGPTIARMLSERFGTRIIYVTANAAQIDYPAATALGAINKPFSCETIRAVVAYALDETLAVPRPPELHALSGLELLRSA